MYFFINILNTLFSVLMIFKSKSKNIAIDCETNSANNPRSPFGKINEEIIQLAILMKKLAIQNNINYQISYQWNEKHKKFIEEN